jgi:tRNA threonylcarbamoyladenosine biosynthesis protein TsaE
MDEFVIDSQDELPDVAAQIVERLAEQPVAAFYGHMGAGKTTLIKEIAAQLGVEEVVTSPTFALVNQYITRNGDPVYHFDFYRIDRIEEAFDLGYEEYFYSGNICLVEWPEKIEELMPYEVLRIHIATSENDNETRTIVIE